MMQNATIKRTLSKFMSFGRSDPFVWFRGRGLDIMVAHHNLSSFPRHQDHGGWVYQILPMQQYKEGAWSCPPFRAMAECLDLDRRSIMITLFSHLFGS
jgi:hypothetical protein